MGQPDVKLKRKVQLREKSGEAVSTTATASKSKAWLWSVVALAVILLGVWAFSRSDNSADEQQENDNLMAATEQTETIESTTVAEASEESSDDNASTGAAEVDGAVSDIPSESANNVAGQSAESTPKTTTEKRDSASAPISVSSDVEAEAMKVIRGDYGNGLERKDRLGSNYQAIQNRVNELKREGLF